MLTFLLLITGLTGLWLGTRLTVSKAAGIAKQFRVSELFIGLTVISIGTDLPELMVTITASIHTLHGQPSSGVLLGNALGSGLSQSALILGIAALFGKLSITRRQAMRDSISMIIATVILFIISYDHVIFWYEGLVCLAAYGYYFYRLYHYEKTTEDSIPGNKKQNFIDFALLIAGLVIVVYASEITIRSALQIAERYAISQPVIGIFIIGIGTSLPELAVSIRAAAGKTFSLSIGTLVGSTLFDTLVPAGVGSLIATIQVENSILRNEIPALFCLSILLMIFLMAKRGIQLREAVILILFYVVYAIWRLLQAA